MASRRGSVPVDAGAAAAALDARELLGEQRADRPRTATPWASAHGHAGGPGHVIKSPIASHTPKLFASFGERDSSGIDEDGCDVNEVEAAGNTVVREDHSVPLRPHTHRL